MKAKLIKKFRGLDLNLMLQELKTNFTLSSQHVYISNTEIGTRF